jgi:hypothetical protein
VQRKNEAEKNTHAQSDYTRSIPAVLVPLEANCNGPNLAFLFMLWLRNAVHNRPGNVRHEKKLQTADGESLEAARLAISVGALAPTG